MSEGSAIDDIMTPHVGCEVTFVNTQGPVGFVAEEEGEGRLVVYWGRQDDRSVFTREPSDTLSVLRTAKQVEQERAAG